MSSFSIVFRDTQDDLGSPVSITVIAQKEKFLTLLVLGLFLPSLIDTKIISLLTSVCHCPHHPHQNEHACQHSDSWARSLLLNTPSVCSQSIIKTPRILGLHCQEYISVACFIVLFGSLHCEKTVHFTKICEPMTSMGTYHPPQYCFLSYLSSSPKSIYK